MPPRNVRQLDEDQVAKTAPTSAPAAERVTEEVPDPIAPGSRYGKDTDDSWYSLLESALPPGNPDFLRQGVDIGDYLELLAALTREGVFHPLTDRIPPELRYLSADLYQRLNTNSNHSPYRVLGIDGVALHQGKPSGLIRDVVIHSYKDGDLNADFALTAFAQALVGAQLAVYSDAECRSFIVRTRDGARNKNGALLPNWYKLECADFDPAVDSHLFFGQNIPIPTRRIRTVSATDNGAKIDEQGLTLKFHRPGLDGTDEQIVEMKLLSPKAQNPHKIQRTWKDKFFSK